MLFDGFLDHFKSPEFWFPTNVTGNDVFIRDNVQFPIIWALLDKLTFVVILLFVARFLLIRLVFLKWGTRMNITIYRSKKAPSCQELEEIYLKEGPSAIQTPGRMKKMSGNTGLTEKQVYNWFKIRRLQDEVSDMDKFIEDCWMTGYSTVLCALGWYALIDKPKLWGLSIYWTNYPLQSVQAQDEWFYLSAMATSVIDSVVLAFKKHETLDLRLRIYHHVLVFLLLAVAWTSNEVHLGTLLLYMLETFAPFSYASKVAKWLKWSKTSQILFGVGIAHWFFIRTVWFHIVAVPSVFVHRHLHAGCVPAYLLLDILLAQLVITNFIWIKMFCTKISKTISHGETPTREIDDNSWSEIEIALKSVQ